MKIGMLGTGSWGYCLATILAAKGHHLTCWTTKKEFAEQLNKTRQHPFLPPNPGKGSLSVTTALDELLLDAELIVESVTSAGLRPVLEKVKDLCELQVPIVVTSKGIEQNSGLILPDVVIDVLGEKYRSKVGVLSGPGYAQEVIRGLPTSVVSSAFAPNIALLISEVFMTDSFRVYPNSDVRGVAFGGALKNIIAIACGISDGLQLGWSAKAALMTRGLHEIRKLAVASGCKAETFGGLSGMGDLCMTCSCNISRNFRFGEILAVGKSPDEALTEIKTVVEGAYTCLSAMQLAKQYKIAMPITETVHEIIYAGLKPIEAVKRLMTRPIKEENQ